MIRLRETLMIWTAERNRHQGALLDAMYQQAARMLCERKAVLSGGRPERARLMPSLRPASTQADP
jgi:hypothetical protein